MNFDSYVAKQSPPPESSCCRQKSRFDSRDDDTDDQLKGEASKDARRRRVNLRKIRSFSHAKSAAESSVGLKNIRDEIQKETIEGTPVDLAPEEEDAEERGSVRCRPYGKISVVGRRREMEDIVAVELGFLKRGEESYDFFGVLNCHGGWRMGNACGGQMLAKIVEEKQSSEKIDWEGVIIAWFHKLEAEVNKKGAAVASMLSTAVVVVVGGNEVVVANCGSSSRAVLSRGGVAVHLSADCKHDKDDESQRAGVCGGNAVNWKGQKVLGALATSRSKEPEIRVIISRSHADDEFLIMGSNGLWDVIPNELACWAARRYFHGGMRSDRHFTRAPQGDDHIVEDIDQFDETRRLIRESGGANAAAAFLAELAMVRGTSENISIIVVDLKG